MSERMIEEARRLAAREHAGQARKANGAPYLEHVSAVAEILEDAGFDDDVLAAALLHDAVEHTPVEAGEIARTFGERVGALVAAMTDRDEVEPWAERKAEHRNRVLAAGRDAVAIYAADKLAGMREVRDGFEEAGAGVEERLGNSLAARLSVWESDLAAVRSQAPPLPFMDRLEREFSALRADLAAAGHLSSGGARSAAGTTASNRR